MGKDENLFFKSLEKVVKVKYLKFNVSKSDVFFNSNYKLYNFPENVMNVVESILFELLNNEGIKSRSLSNKIDCLIYNHPKYGNRIVEFDEEQHFNPFRKCTLNYVSKLIDPKCRYYNKLIYYCDELSYYKKMLKKHRIKSNGSIPVNQLLFQKYIEENKKENNKYIKFVNGFQFWGGRIAQRAYYDCLRDLAHLSERNKSLLPAFRFSKYEFEKKAGKIFSRISHNELNKMIESYINELIDIFPTKEIVK